MTYYNNNGNKSNSNKHRPPEPTKIAEPKKLPADYVDTAEKVIVNLKDNEKNIISTSKVRNLLSIVSDIYNNERLSNENELSNDSIMKLNMLRIRVAYESGRTKEAKIFINKAELISYIKGIGKDRKEFINFARYMEALVAYHRFYFGKKEER